MRIVFLATNAGFDADEYSIICGVDGRDANGVEHALSFERVSEQEAKENPSEDSGVHTQFDDQSNGAYRRVRKCRLSRTCLTVDLSGQLGRLVGVDGFDVELMLDDELYEQVRSGLIRIFRDLPDTLIISD